MTVLYGELEWLVFVREIISLSGYLHCLCVSQCSYCESDCLIVSYILPSQPEVLEKNELIED